MGNVFVAVLAAAVKEWLLMLLLFLNASFSYLVTKFARSNKLQLPCLMCSRLDHVLGKQKDGFYWDLICDHHKFTLSSLVLCKRHNKLVDVHHLCETCLFSFATVDKSNAQTYRLLVGKLGHDPSLADQDHALGDSGTRKRCCCCNEKWITSGHDTRSFGSPLSVCGRNEHDGVTDVLFQDIMTGERSIDLLPDVEYEKVRITESVAFLSDDDCVTEHGKEKVASDDQEKDLPLVPDVASEKMDLKLQAEASDFLSAPIGYDVEYVNQPQAKDQIDSAATHDLISFSDAPLPCSNVIQSSAGGSGDKLNIVGDTDLEKAVTTGSKLTQLPLNSTQAIGKQSDLKSGKCDFGFQIPRALELGDAYKLAVLSRGRQLSGKFLEQKSFKDSPSISEDLKLLLSQLSATRGIEPLYDISPRVSGNNDDFRTSDASNSFGLQILQKRMSLERNESGISLDGSMVSEVEGESEVDRLKRQVEHDRKLMRALYQELEEERNASAVAANQTMAMITRLQEEKAAFQLEALQFIRLMEEQAEYDGEDLQKANDLLAKKEQDVQALEMELEGHRKKLGVLPKITSTVDENLESIVTEPKQTDCSNIQQNVRMSSLNGNMLEIDSGTDEAAKYKAESINLESSLLESENLPSFLHEVLRELEKKFQLFSRKDGSSFIPNDENHLLAEESEGACEQQNSSRASFGNDVTEKDRFSEQCALHEGSHSAGGESSGKCKENQQLCPGSGELMHVQLVRWDTESDVLRKQFPVLSRRLEALEAECRFLENSIKSLSKGDEGLKFVQKIAFHLQELHALSFKSRN